MKMKWVMLMRNENEMGYADDNSYVADIVFYVQKSFFFNSQ